ncbi:hypothetical protein O6H91_09G049200 [Diphasiastrum complanatum]|uniref:Uncharacterized protein n=1 Tax=Diphasiastrum complanatum TaxID=34168 RepID=A0ACC2CP07_DIPCM|nr:hypothetical protein O6H91_09G049200 [Diphasiastrum complanatum]
MGRSVLVLNSGSSSLKYALYNLEKSAKCLFRGVVEGIGASKSLIAHKNAQDARDVKLQGINVTNHRIGLNKVWELLHLDKDLSSSICAVGHRVAHGGETLTKPALITDTVKKAIEKAVLLAPLHNPPNLEGIKAAEELFHCPQVAVFDTAFHSTLPPYAYMYALPLSLYMELGLRRYGFHGTSYQCVLDQAANLLLKPKNNLNVIICHLGAGASMAAIRQGNCIDTTMGVTPLEGLVMATRSGDVDSGVMQILASEKGLSMQEINTLLNKESGLYGICGDKDMRVVLEAAQAGSEKHKLALDVFVHRIKKYLGAYLVHLEGKVDALVFTAGIGERSPPIRSMICHGLNAFGISLDHKKNYQDTNEKREIQSSTSKVKILVVPTDEELCIAQQTLELLSTIEPKSV